MTQKALNRDADWLAFNLISLAKATLTNAGLDLYRRAAIRFLPFCELNKCAAGGDLGILLPIDLPTPLRPERVWRVPFGRSEISAYNPVPAPGDAWNAYPNEAFPLWWRHANGALVPAWDIAGNLADLWSFREDREILTRDRYGRLPVEASPRAAAGLIEVPTANEALAALVDAAEALENGCAPSMAPSAGLIAPPALALSHDCDILLGDDFWTQAARVKRVVAPLVHGRKPDLASAKALLDNVRDPAQFFADDLRRMWHLEEEYGFASISYILNGTRGRQYARSSFGASARVIQEKSSKREIGIHYNWDTYLADDPFVRQKNEIESVYGAPVDSGRAHYLRFDPLVSPAFLHRHGIALDESLGWAYTPSFRGGTAGPFTPVDSPLVLLPLNIMDNVLLRDGLAPFKRLLLHLETMGGVLSVLVHPGMNENPEYPTLAGVYEGMLDLARSTGCRSLLRGDLLSTAGVRVGCR